MDNNTVEHLLDSEKALDIINEYRDRFSEIISETLAIINLAGMPDSFSQLKPYDQFLVFSLLSRNLELVQKEFDSFFVLHYDARNTPRA